MSTEPTNVPRYILAEAESVRMWMETNGCTELGGVALRAQLTEAQEELRTGTSGLIRQIKIRDKMVETLQGALEYYAAAPWAAVGGVSWYNYDFAKRAMDALAAIDAAIASSATEATP